MSKVRLDQIDLRILEVLQKNGRITNVELAQKAGVSAPPCLRRVRALEEAGYITGYHADVTASLLDFKVTVFARVGLSSQAENDLQDFEDLVETWPVVRECYMMAGESDFLLKIVAKNWEDYQEFVTTKLTSAPHVAHVKSSLTIRKSKHRPGAPIPSRKTEIEA